MKKFGAFCIVCMVALASAASDDPVRLFELTCKPTRLSLFPGTVHYARTMTLSFEDSGILAYVARVGQSARSGLFDAEGKVSRPGDLLARKDSVIAETSVRIAEAKLREAELKLSENTQNFERDRKLFEKGAVSARQYLQTRIEYESAVYDRIGGQAALEQARRVWDGCFLRAPFPCVVEEVFLPAGTGVDTAQAVLKVAALEAMKIVIPLPEYVTQQLDQTVQVSIYPPGEVEPTIAWFQDSDIKTGVLECYVDNPTVPVGTLTPAQAKLPQVRELNFVFEPTRTSGDAAALWINPQAIFTEEGKSYVWKLKGVEAFVISSPIPREFVLEKVPVEALGVEYNQGMYRLRGIAENSNLKPYDLVAGIVPDGVKSGDKVVYQSVVRKFRAGEKVNVVLAGEFTRNLYTVPRAALRRNAKSGNFEVMVVRDGKVDVVCVFLASEVKEYAHIVSPKLAEGMLVVIAPLHGDLRLSPDVLAKAPVEKLDHEDD